MTGNHESHITVGSQKFHLVATPVVDKHGKRAGTIVEWRNETVEKAIETEIDGIVNAAVGRRFLAARAARRQEGLHAQSRHVDELAVREHRQSVLEDLIGMLSALAGGDLTPRITAEYQGHVRVS